MNLRPYQSDCMAGNARALEEFDRVLDVIPTGGGKTIIFSNEASRRAAAGERTLILADRDELINQAQKKLTLATGIKSTREKAEDYGDFDSQVVVASIQTMARRYQRWPKDHFGLIVCDEADLSLAASWQTVLKHFDAQVLGVTATPDRGDKRNLGEFYQTVGYEISLFDLINQGYLSPIRLKSIPLTIDISSVGSSGGDFKEEELGSAIEPYLDQIVASIKQHAHARRILAFLPLIDTSKKFVAACGKIGLDAVHVDGQSQDRADLIKYFEDGNCSILSNSALLIRGYDVDSEPTGIGIDCIVDLSPTRSRSRYAQKVGRGTRTAIFKDNLLLLDFLWHHERHSIIKPASLISHDEVEVEEISSEAAEMGKPMPGDVADDLPELDLQLVFSSAQEKRLAKELEAQKHRVATTISPEQMASLYHDSEISHFEPVMQSEQRPITDKQMKWLEKAMIDDKGRVYFRGGSPKGSKPLDISKIKGEVHASKVLSHLFSEKNRGIATASVAQKKLMAQMGYANAGEATADEARKFFSNIRKPKEEVLL